MSDIQTISEHDAAVALLQDTFSGIDFGMALMDEDLNFVMFNEKYVDLAFGDGVLPKIGESAVELAVKQLQTGFYVLPDGLDPATMSDALIDAVKSCHAEIPLMLRDGRHLVASSKRTALGGYLLTLTDVTDRKRAAQADEIRGRTVTDLVESLDEGVSLWDHDLRFMMCNDQYMKDSMTFRTAPPAIGTPGEVIIREAYQSGAFVTPEGMTEQQWVDYYHNWARTHAGPIESQWKDGRTIVVTSKKNRSRWRPDHNQRRHRGTQ